MKTLLGIAFAFVLHPLAVVLVWKNLIGRSDIGFGKKLLWGTISLLWGVGPLLYIYLGDGAFW